MLHNWGRMSQGVIYPLLAAQLYLIFLFYFIAVRKHVSSYFAYYIFFLVGLIFYLITKPVQDFSSFTAQVRYTRTFVLFAVGAPSLVMAALLQCGYQIRTRYVVAIYFLGFMFAGTYTALYDLTRGSNGYLFELGITRELFLEYFPKSFYNHRRPQSVGSVVMFLIPSLVLLIKELLGKHKKEPIVFVVGTLIFSISFAYGSITYEFWVYYLGAFISAPFWGWAIIHEIRELKSKADKFIALIPGQEIVPAEVAFDQTVMVIKEIIDQNFTRDLGVDEISELAKVSRSHCMKLFKEQTGLTINQYLTEVRICSAKLLLLSKSVTDTAFGVGYNDSNYFSKVFKKHTGLSPAQYKSSVKNEVVQNDRVK